MLTELFGAAHPLNQRYFSFQMLLDSIKANKENLVDFNKKNLALYKEANGETSHFILDALLTEISVKSDMEEGEQSIADTLKKMELVSKESNYTT